VRDLCAAFRECREHQQKYGELKTYPEAKDLRSALDKYKRRYKVPTKIDPWSKLETELQRVADGTSDSVSGKIAKAIEEHAAPIVNHVKYRHQEQELQTAVTLMSKKFPGMAEDRNATWLMASYLRGKRVRVKESDGTHSYRILITKRKRDRGKMLEWLKRHAVDMGREEFNREYDQGSSPDPFAETQKGNVPAGYEIHHIIPLYCGAENGGVDSGSNYLLISRSEHEKAHSRGGDAYDTWGPGVRLYRDKDHPNDELEIDDED
jgi:5-methylcytosine-specific restriction endonuclease McrA